ncbi:hypothetical protein M2272_002647 [Mycobacterium frederiksbergense]|uniref:DUF3703 domain-containing protein n=1 Tax=Mycolicibacterium frederiksbergense TaxID=117567 RepID=A0ABT6L1C1_9MYCO|nr:DUF3703 domain-containing protein [Mycolicibacterium frederiksbergense]MDH6196007.1 hypothetical protein [Mycolicibacterium frederiksbergense]
MTAITAEARRIYRSEMQAARDAGDAKARWRHLERAHIVSQPDPWLHTCNHGAMLVLALRQRDRREALGQVVRLIVAAPGSVTGRYPLGNTGRVGAGLMTPMPIPPDLASVLTA